ncbi:MAG: carboxypeptidase regulatory-like domain-containing protein [Thermoanaerobaculia bacterium]|nr:carboxypeptidase regulatory-like domain-containing protein [Thermoanaerobaculia bacterium]
MQRLARVVLVGGLCLAVLAPAAWSQSQATTGTIEGIVVDDDGERMPGVTVSVTNTATSYSRTVVTDDEGRFRFPLLPLGPYRLGAELEGFAPLTREGLRVSLGDAIALELTMQLATVQQEIIVTAEAPLIESTPTESTTRIDDEAVEGLPNNDRNFLNFSKLTPGVTIVQGPDGEELSISGQKGINNNISIDGADFNNPFFGEQRGGQRPAFTFNQDAVKEILVVTDGAPAEFGRSSGGFVNVVTKSGTNDFSGTAHLFFKNDSLSDDLELPDGSIDQREFDQTQVGFTLGGPVRKDKVFFFVAVDTQEADETKQTNPGRIAPEVVNFLASVGLPNDNAPITRTDDGDAYLAKIDWLASDRNLATLRWAYHYSQQENGTFDVPSWGASANAIETDYAHGYTGTLISTISGSLLNELRLQYAKEWRPRPYNGPDVPGQSRPFPDTAFDFVGQYRVGMPFFIPVEYDDDRTQINENLSILKGSHSVKAGFEYNDVTSAQTFIGFANGRYIFDSFDGFMNYVTFGPGWGRCSGGGTTTTGSCPAGESFSGPLLLFLQQAGVGDLSVRDAGTQAIEQLETAVFIQDQWQPTPSLTLEAGLRWEELDNAEVITPPNQVFFAPFIGQTVVTGAGPQVFPSDGTIPDDDSLQPRFALSWAPKKLTERPGVLRLSAGLYAARIPALTLASTRSTNGSRGQTLFRASFFNDFGVTPPTWPNLIPQEEIGDPFLPDVFVFNSDFELPETFSWAVSWEQELIPNWAFLAKVSFANTNHITRFINRNDPAFGSPWSTGLPPGGANGINTLTSVESSAKSRYQGYTVGVNKRYSKGYQFQAYYTNSLDRSDDDNERDPFSFRYADPTRLDAEYSFSDRHQRHRINAWLLWDGPWGINVNVRASYRSAQPQSIRADGTPAATPQDRINPDGTITRRNLGKKNNQFRTLDVRLSKDFKIGDMTLQPVIDVFNLTDEDNFLVPQVTNLVFNFDGTVQSGAGLPREFQVGVRLLW